MKHGIPLVLLILFVHALPAQESITQENVERIIQTLAADSMEGRASFSEGNAKAAAFIQHEFEAIGLQPLTDSINVGGLRQDFPVYSIQQSHVEVSINGKPVDPEKILAHTGREHTTWTEKDSIAVIYIFEGDDFRQKIGEVLRGHEDAIVMADSSHVQSFQRYRKYFAEGSLSLGPEYEAGFVIVLDRAIEPHRYSIRVENTIERKTLTNIVGVLPGKTREMVIFSSHYDHLGILPPVHGDSIANGADDDASGISAVISLAKYFSTLGQPVRTLVFVAFAAEELGGYGSQYFSKHIDPAIITAMFNIEMIGTPAKFGQNTLWMTGFDLSSLGQIVRRNLMGSSYELHADPYPVQGLFYRSDNAKLARLGVPAHSFSTSQIDIDKLYHTVGDEASTLDFANTASIIRALALGAGSIVSGIDTPSRIDTTKLR